MYLTKLELLNFETEGDTLYRKSKQIPIKISGFRRNIHDIFSPFNEEFCHCRINGVMASHLEINKLCVNKQLHSWNLRKDR